MAIGRHTAAAVQNIGGIVGSAMDRSAMVQLQQEEEQRKYDQRQAERLEDREWEREKFDIQQESATAKAQQAERRHQETLAAAKERNLRDIQSREKIAENRIAADQASGTGTGYTYAQRLDDLRSDITNQRRVVDNLAEEAAYAGDESGLKSARARLQALEREYGSVYREASGKPDPELPGDIRFDKGLVGQGMGVFREGQGRAGDATPPAPQQRGTGLVEQATIEPVTAQPAPAQEDRTSARGAVRITSEEEYDALEPGTVFRGPDGETRRKPVADNASVTGEVPVATTTAATPVATTTAATPVATTTAATPVENIFTVGAAEPETPIGRQYLDRGARAVREGALSAAGGVSDYVSGLPERRATQAREDIQYFTEAGVDRVARPQVLARLDAIYRDESMPEDVRQSALELARRINSGG